MASLDENLLKLSRKYLFPIIEEKCALLRSNTSEDNFVDLGVGDISMPLAPTIVKGFKDAIDEMGEDVIGYGPAQGYEFLRQALVDSEHYQTNISIDEIFISEGINSDICGMQELFCQTSRVGIIDPAYPVYYDLNVMSGRKHIVKLPLTQENGFMPDLPEEKLDYVYLTSPGNPTGVALDKECLKKWVDWAKEVECVIFFDAAYSSFIRSENVPLSIYEIEGAKEVAVEFRSFSKSAGFTGIRLGYCVVPKEIQLKSADGKKHSLSKLWLNRQSTKTNGISYPIQRAGLAALSLQGTKECKKQIDSYLEGTKLIKDKLEEMGFTCFGGVDSPYIWWKIHSVKSWDWFDKLLEECFIVSIPGEGFGSFGEGFIRLSGFVTIYEAKLAIKNLSRLGAKK